jgi:hypothetical protein
MIRYINAPPVYWNQFDQSLTSGFTILVDCDREEYPSSGVLFDLSRSSWVRGRPNIAVSLIGTGLTGIVV